ESAPERLWNPSELFSQAYFVARNAPLSQETIEMLQEKTSAWLKDQELFESAPAADAEIDQTRIAYEARRTEGEFGEYEFALLALRRGFEKRLPIFAPPAAALCPIGGAPAGVMPLRWLIFSRASWRKRMPGHEWRRSGNWSRPSSFP